MSEHNHEIKRRLTPHAIEAVHPHEAAAWYRWMLRVEVGLSLVVLGLMTLLPLLNAAVRVFHSTGIPDSMVYAQNLTLVVAFLGAAIAARRGEHLSLSAAAEILPRGASRWTDLVSGSLAAVVSGLLTYAALVFVRAEMESILKLSIGIPIWVVEAVIPLGFGLVTLRLALRFRNRLLGLGVPLLLGGLLAAIGLFELEIPGLFWILLTVLVVGVLLGAPIFVAIGGLAMLLFWDQFTPLSAVVVETYRLVSSPTLPAIPLFTLAGFLLAGGGASKRLVAVFEALFGWAPGGTAVAAALVCAFFTTFTGASGVTILALGGLLLPALVQAGNGEKFSLGLITASGSLGLLFFPSLPVILYAVVADVDVAQMFAGAVLPGFVVVGSVVVLGVHYGLRHRDRTLVPFSRARALQTVWVAKWELLLPAVVLVGFLSGYLTFVESAALAALYAFVTEVLIYRDLDVRKGLPESVVACVSLVGAVLTILGVALGLTSYFVDAEVPTAVIEWTQQNIDSRLLFLLVLNVVLLGVGCVMDIFSAIVVVAPLVAPVGVAFGVHPIHLGVVFLANLELGYITPPVGMNLFLSSMRFNKSLGEVYSSTVLFFFFRVAAILIVTYVPFLTIWLADLFAPTM